VVVVVIIMVIVIIIVVVSVVIVVVVVGIVAVDRSIWSRVGAAVEGLWEGAEGEAGWYGGWEVGGIGAEVAVIIAGSGGCCVSHCNIGTSESLAEVSLLQCICQLCSTDARCGEVKVVGLVVGGVEKDSGWVGGRKGFGVVGFGILSSKQKATRSLSKQAEKPGSSSVGASLVYKGLGEGIELVGEGAVVIAAAADQFGSWRQLSCG